MMGGEELKKFYRENQTLVIYGAGKYGAKIEAFLRRKNISIFCFCVTRIDEKENFLGYPVKEFPEIQRDFPDAGVIVAVSEKFSGEILEKVEGMHFFYDRDLLREIEKEGLETEAKERSKAVEVENRMLCKVGDTRFRKDATYLVCPGSIGDTLYVASLVKVYKHRNGIRRVILVVRRNQEGIAELFPSIDGSMVSNEVVEAMDLYSKSKAVWELNNYLYGFAREDFSHNSYMHPFQEKNLLSGYKAAIMGLAEEAECEEMQVDQGTPISSDRFHRKTIIVMPHESSARRLPLSLWEELCRALSESYTVYTNTKDETEQPVKGTQAVSESLKDMPGICEQCFAVISIRTGMCDLLAFTRSNLIVLNTEHILAEKWDLKKVFARENLVNIDCYGELDEASLIHSILIQLQNFS